MAAAVTKFVASRNGAAAFALLATVSCTSIAVDARTLEGALWHVTAINGQTTPRSSRFQVEFGRGTLTAAMGCNTLSGNYTVAGGMVRPGPGPVRATEMACESDPPTTVSLMTFERWGFAILGQPMRIGWSADNRLTLTNAAGSIALLRGN